MSSSGKRGKKPTSQVESLREGKGKVEPLRPHVEKGAIGEQTLGQSWDYWERTFNAATDLIMLVDGEFKIVKANAATLHFLGKSMEDVRGRTCSELMHGADVPPEECPLKRAMQTKKREEVELYVASKKVWVTVSVDPVLDDRGNVVRAVHIVRDITERKAREEEAKKSRELIEKTFASLDIAIFILDNSVPPVIIDCNPAACSIFGYEKDQMLKRTTEFLHISRDKLLEFQEALYPLAEKGGGLSFFEFQMKRRNGQVFPTLHSVLPLKNESGNRIGWISVIRDITERKKAEEEIASHNERLKYLLGATTAVIYTSEASGDYGTIFISENVEKITGYKVNQFVEDRSFWISHVHPDDLAHVYSEVSKLFEKGEHAYEYRFRCSNGTYLWVSDQMRLVRDAEGQPKEIVGYWTDITERKKAEEVLRDREQRLASIYDTVGDVIFQLAVEKDGRYRFASVNQAFLTTTGLTSVQVVGKRVDEVIPEPTLSMVLEKYAAAIQKKGTVRWEETSEYPTGRLTGEVSIAPVIDEAGHCAYLVGAVHDITDRKRAEEALRESTEKFNTFMEQLPVTVFMKDENSRVQYVNPYMAKEFGADKWIGLTAKDYYPAEVAEGILAHDKRALSEGPSTREEWVPDKDGRMRCMSTTKFLLQRESKAPLIGGMAIDITERKIAEEAIRRQSAVLNAVKRVFEETLRCQSDTDVARVCLAVAEDLTGSKFGFIGEVNEFGRYDTMALSDPGWEACRMPKSKAVKMIKDMEIRGIWGRVLKDEQSLIVNDPGIHPDSVGIPKGHPLITSFLGVPLKRGGKTFGMIGLGNKESGYDLDDQQAIETLSVSFVEALMRKRAEVLLRESEGRLEAALNAAELGTWDWDLVTGKITWSGHHDKLFGFSEGEFDGRYETFEKRIHPEDREGLKEAVERALREKSEYSHEYRAVWPDGTIRWMAGRGRYHWNEKGEAVRMFGAVHDITERKTAEEEIEKLARFPSENPNPILRISDSGVVLYSNEASVPLLEAWQCGTGQRLPEYWHEFVLVSLNRRQVQETEVECGGRVYSLKFTPVIRGKYVNIYGMDITERKAAEAKLIDYQKWLKSLASELSLAEEHERRRLAKGVHDQIGQKLALTKLTLRSLMESISESNVLASLGAISDELDDVIEETHLLTFELSNPILYELGLEKAVEKWLAEQIEGKHGIKCKFISETEPLSLDEQSRGILFQDIQELLANIVMHAKAKTVEVRIAQAGEMVQVTVRDDGVGFDPSGIYASMGEGRTGGFGLFGIRERLEYLGGSMRIESAPGKGSSIVLSLPLRRDLRKSS